ncbi:MAG: SHOCT domain-containing protein [Phycisphaerae bacterium]|nr:SHOCT domain-containing protein [Phycisphaerae bacterium]
MTFAGTSIWSAGCVVSATQHALAATPTSGSGGASGVGADRLLLSILPYLGLLVAVVVVGWFAVVWVRRLMRGDARRDAGFALEDLRQMHRRGEIDDEEFARAKAALVGRARDANRDARRTGGWEESGRRGPPTDEP